MVNKSAAIFMHRPCQEAAEALAENWKDCMIRNQSVPDLESQLYQWSIEGKTLFLLYIEQNSHFHCQ